MNAFDNRGGSAFPAFLLGLVAGGVLMYLLDPEEGEQRRSFARDKAFDFADDARRQATKLAGGAGDFAQKKADELRAQAEGLLAQARALVGAR